ncbi:MAG: phospholipase [Planctomycetota bacterium]
MSADYGLLNTLHSKLRQITDLNGRIRKGPYKIKVVEANEENFTQAFEEIKEKLTALRKASSAKNLHLSEREAKVEDMKAKLNSCESNKEFQLLKDRIAADEQANSVLQDEIFEQLEKIDAYVQEAEEAEKNLNKAKSETQSVREKVIAEIKLLQAEKSDVQTELAAEEGKLPRDTLVEYKRLVAAKGEDALGSTDTETCQTCNQRLTTQEASELLMKKLIFCKGCGCLLYLTANRR